MSRQSTILALLVSVGMGASYAVGQLVGSAEKVQNQPTPPVKEVHASANRSGELLRPSEYGYQNFGPRQAREDDQPSKTAQVPRDNPYGHEAVVKSVQSRLQQEGYQIDKVDGVLDAQTQRALSQYQNTQGITSSGRINQPTLDALGIVIIQDAEIEDEALYSE